MNQRTFHWTGFGRRLALPVAPTLLLLLGESIAAGVVQAADEPPASDPGASARQVLEAKREAEMLAQSGATGVSPVHGQDARGTQRAAARQILEATGIQGGLIVQLGCGDGKLTAALCADDRFLVHALDADPRKVEDARQHIRSLGLYGKVSVDRLRGDRLPYGDNLVGLLVAEDLGRVPFWETLRVLKPGGVAYLREQGRWTKHIKYWPEAMDEWTHWLHGADGNAVAQDRLVGPPRRVQWIERPLWQRHHELNASVAAMVSADGRVFYICDEAPATVSGLPDRWTLIARDAFSGVLLWKRPMPDWGWKTWSLREPGGRFNVPIEIPRRLVAVGNRVYVTLGFNAPLTALDAATGETVHTYAGTEFTDEILYDVGTLVLSVNTQPQGPGLFGESPPVKKKIMAIDAESGKTLWTQGDHVGISSKFDFFERITHLSLAVAGQKAFFVEEDAVVGLDLATGRELWRSKRPEKTDSRGHVPYKPFNLCTLVAQPEVVLFAQPDEPYTRKTWNRGVKGKLTGFSAETGEVLWTQPCGKWGPGVKGDVFVIGDLVWTHAVDEHAVIGIDPHTGQIRREFSTAAAFNEVHHHRCYRNKATERYLLTARRGIELIDLENEQCQTHDWVRGTCRYGIMPCNGPLAAGRDEGLGERDEGLGERDEGRGARDEAQPLERGPAFGQIRNLKSEIRNPDPWPTYRHDFRRSGSTRAGVPADLERLWQTSMGGRLSACTIAEAKVFVASVDEHRVCALDLEDGRLLWSYTAGGRVDTPPTIFQGLALFGSADGWVYCLRASDGQLAWRHRVAPQERWIVAFGQLESAWPVHGTVLVKDGVAYAAAGRSTYLDGGIRVVALDPQTGRLLGELAPLGGKSDGLEDVLVSDGTDVYMRHLKFRLEGNPAASPDASRASAARQPRAFSTAGLLDDTYFSRVGWSTGGKGGADLLVFDESATYTVRTRRQGGFGGWFQAQSGAYELAALDRPANKPAWSTTIPIRVRAMAAAGETLFIAGPSDVAPADDPHAAFEGRLGARLRAVSTGDGSTLAEWNLPSTPVFDGLSAAAGRLFLSTADGNLTCFGNRE